MREDRKGGRRVIGRMSFSVLWSVNARGRGRNYLWCLSSTNQCKIHWVQGIIFVF